MDEITVLIDTSKINKDWITKNEFTRKNGEIVSHPQLGIVLRKAKSGKYYAKQQIPSDDYKKLKAEAEAAKEAGNGNGYVETPILGNVLVRDSGAQRYTKSEPEVASDDFMGGDSNDPF